MFGSFLSFYYLFKGLEENKIMHWCLFGGFSFLNFTNVLLGGMTLPVLFLVAIIYFFRKWKLIKFSISELKSRALCFLLFFGISTLAGLCLYHLRGLNLLGAFWDIAVTHEVDPKVNADNLVMEKSFHSGLLRLLYTVFVTFNFEHGDGSNSIIGIPEGPWIYFVFFLLGVWRLFHSHREVFWDFTAIFLMPILISGVILRISEARFLAFIHPFYLITVAIGFIYCFKYLVKLLSSEPIREGVILSLAFLLFVWGTHPKPLWGYSVYDELFETKNVREFRDYFRAHLKENDIIFNITDTTELRAEIGDALNLISYNFYLKEFKENHRLELLPLKTGRVGIWLILMTPLTNDNLVPFYFPGTYSPRLIEHVKNAYLYYGEIDIPKNIDILEDFQFTTPFWSFMKGFIFHSKSKFKEANVYYQAATQYGYNLERIYYNLGAINLNRLNIALSYFEKAIETIETPTLTKDINEVKSWQTYGSNKRGLPDIVNKLPQFRHIYVEKNGVKYKKWFVEDKIKAYPNYFSEFYINAVVILRTLYLKTGNPIYLKKIKMTLKKGAQLTNTPFLVMMYEVANTYDGTFLTENPNFKNLNEIKVPIISLLGINEMYPPIKMN